jgi:hypothetical protein
MAPQVHATFAMGIILERAASDVKRGPAIALTPRPIGLASEKLRLGRTWEAGKGPRSYLKRKRRENRRYCGK